MKIAGFYCSCVGRNVAIDHYSSMSCKNPPMPIPWILGAIHKQTSDDVHCGNQMSASRLTHCLRAMAIEDNIPSVINVQDLDAATAGTAMHEFMQRHTPKGMLAEMELPAEGKPKAMLFAGTDCEIEVRGRLDVVNLNTAILEDYKTTSEWSQKFRFERGAADGEWNVQASVYRILLKRCEGIEIKHAAVWSGARVGKKSKAPAWFKIPITFMNEEEILDFHPLDGQYSVRDIIREYKLFVARLSEMPAEQAVAMIPLMGAVTKRYKQCDYCTVKRICDEIAGEAEW